MIISPRAKRVIDIVRIENQDRIVEIEEVFLYRRTGKGKPYEKIPYWIRGIHAITSYDDLYEVDKKSYYEWGDEIGEWGTELTKGKWGTLIPKP